MVKIPESITVNTGDTQRIRSQIDRFLKDTYEEIKVREDLGDGLSLHPYFEIKSGELCFDPISRTISNDRITCLKYKDQLVALVAETRTQMNFVHFDFFLSMPDSHPTEKKTTAKGKKSLRNPKKSLK